MNKYILLFILSTISVYAKLPSLDIEKIFNFNYLQKEENIIKYLDSVGFKYNPNSSFYIDGEKYDCTTVPQLIVNDIEIRLNTHQNVDKKDSMFIVDGIIWDTDNNVGKYRNIHNAIANLKGKAIKSKDKNKKIIGYEFSNCKYYFAMEDNNHSFTIFQIKRSKK